MGSGVVLSQLSCQAKPATRQTAMSWTELERLVEQAESDPALRRALMHCRSRFELVLAGQRLGFAIDGQDLKLAWRLHQRQTPGHGNEPTRDRQSRRRSGSMRII